MLLRKPFAVFFAAILILSLAASLRAVPSLAQSNASQPAPKSKPAPPPAARIDINHASVDELAKVPGLTRSWAGRIVRFRPYRTKQDLLERGVVSSDVYVRIVDYIIARQKAQ